MGRIILPFSRKTEKHYQQVSVRANPLVRLILSLTKEAITQKQLLQHILTEIPNLNHEKVIQVIHSLIQQEILYPTLLPTLLTESTFLDSIDYLEKSCPSSPLLAKLQKIFISFQNYQTTAIGEGENSLNILRESMKDDNHSSSILQVDAISSEKISLHPDIGFVLSEAIEVLWKISAINKGVPVLRSYHKKFLDKYGTLRLVPLLELLDETIGLGIPEQYLILTEDKDKELPWESWLIEEWSCCIREHRTEILLPEQFIKQFDLNLDPKEAPSSFDVFFGIVPQPSDGNKEDFLILLHGISDSTNGCATLGRFIDLFGKQEKEKVQAFLQEEEADSIAAYAEISYFPFNPRSANVASHSLLRSLKIDLGYSKSQQQAISLEDIVVGATSSYLYLAIKEGRQRLVLYANNVLNLSTAPIVVRFLRDVSRDSVRSFSFFPWNQKETFSFSPSIRYKKTIFSTAKWKLTLPLIGGTTKDSLKMLIQKIEIWANKWSLPRFLFMTWADHQILLDRTHPFHLREIADRLRSSPKTPVILIEKRGKEELVKSNLGSHRCEFVVPFIKSKNYFAPLIAPITFSPIQSSLRKKAPGGEWFYAKIYLPPSNEVRFLTSCLSLLIQQITNMLEKWFFIRYREADGPHVRLRCKIKDLNILSSLLKIFHNWTEELMQKEWIKEVQLATYDREIERYGGEKLIDLAETFFQTDSECALSLLNILLSKKTQFPDYIVASLSLIALLKGFGLSIAQQIALLKQMYLEKELLEGFREWKPKMVSAIFVLNHKHPTSNRELHLFSEIFRKREAQQLSYAIALQKTPHLEDILQSLMHMHCNRILGINLLLEKKSYVYAYHALSTFSLHNHIKNV